jgi:hypothetical protein
MQACQKRYCRFSDLDWLSWLGDNQREDEGTQGVYGGSESGRRMDEDMTCGYQDV